MIPLLLMGGGGHCRSCIDVIECEGRFRIRGILDDRPDRTPVLNYPVLGDDTDLAHLLLESACALVTVGQVKTAETRQRLFTILKAAGAQLPAISSPRAHVSRHARLEEGTIVMHGAVINAGATLGVNCIVNSLALVEHDARIAGHCHIATGARVNGGVEIGSGSFVGSGAIVREGVRIGENVVIGAGSVVLNDVADGALVRGVA